MAKKNVMEKFVKVIGSVAKANKINGAEVDLDIAYAMMKKMYNANQHNLYPGVPADFDWEGFGKELIK